jgi:hypothetical protein
MQDVKVFGENQRMTQNFCANFIQGNTFSFSLMHCTAIAEILCLEPVVEPARQLLYFSAVYEIKSLPMITFD